MNKRAELEGVQVLRAVAVILVVLDHVEGMLAMPKYFGTQVAGGFFAAGTVGVDLFFVISGFIIFYVTDGLNREKVSARSFALRRFCRIIPFLWLCVLTHYGLRMLTVGNIDFAPYARALVLYPVGVVSPTQVWTLRHEAFFYLAAALALAGRTFSLVLAAFLLIPVVWAVLDPVSAQIAEGASWASEVFSLRSNLGFAVGMLAGLAFRKWGSPSLPNSLVLLAMASSPILLLSASNISRQTQSAAPLASALAIATLCAAILFISLGARLTSAGGRFLVLLGAASYATYLTHDAVISVTGNILRRLHLSSLLCGTLITVTACLFVGIAVHLTVEKFVVRQARRLLGDKVDAGSTA